MASKLEKPTEKTSGPGHQQIQRPSLCLAEMGPQKRVCQMPERPASTQIQMQADQRQAHSLRHLCCQTPTETCSGP